MAPVTDNQLYSQILFRVCSAEEWELWRLLRREEEVAAQFPPEPGAHEEIKAKSAFLCEATRQARQLFEQKILSRYAAQRTYTGPAGLPPEGE